MSGAQRPQNPSSLPQVSVTVTSALMTSRATVTTLWEPLPLLPPARVATADAKVDVDGRNNTESSSISDTTPVTIGSA